MQVSIQSYKQEEFLMPIHISNIKADMPTADKAPARVTYALETGKRLGVPAVKIIHGYGSTGPGGRIRTTVRRDLASRKSRGLIRDFIIGEEFSIFNHATLQAFALCPELRQDQDLDRHNNGVTIVLL